MELVQAVDWSFIETLYLAISVGQFVSLWDLGGGQELSIALEGPEETVLARVRNLRSTERLRPSDAYDLALS